ncbi:FitA-like ribbon-helix-helix domain-containing protein [Anabaena azotica]|uniref:FitA-like ribbon-helix-helix domain-containing protein n=1 Tax=Anabaena azotica TaxID=197653 RepID=UPI0039A4687B
MNPIILDDLDPNIIEWLKSRAQKHGHSLQAEVKSILQHLTVRKTEEVKLFAEDIIQCKADLMLQQIQIHSQSIDKNTPELMETSTGNSQQELLEIKAKLKELQSGISLGNLSIREARELGR